MTPHIPTMLMMLVAAFTVMSLSIAFFAHRQHRDLFLLALGLLLHSLGYGLFSLRGHIPDPLSVVGGNGAVSTAVALYLLALYRFQGRPPQRWLLLLPVLASMGGMSLMLDFYPGRRVLSSLVALAQFVHLLVLLWQRRRQTPGRGQYLVGFAALVVCVTMVYRAAALLLGADTAQALTDSTATVVWTFLLVLLSVLLLAVGMLMMAQERAEQALAESELRYRRLIESANEGICVLENGIIRFVNPKGRALFGRSEGELLAHSILDFIHPDDRLLVQQSHARRLQGQADDLKYEARVLGGQEGALRWFEISGVRIDWHGRPATLNFFSDVSERRRLDEQIRDLAYHDALTHLPNRRLFIDHLRLAMAASRRSGRYGAVIFMDLDQFKPLNDRHGHAVGDLLLVEVATRLGHGVRAADTVARFGGDEFVVLLGELGDDATQAAAQARRLADKLIQVLAEPYRLQAGDGQPVLHHCSASAGVVLFQGEAVSAEHLLDLADAAMYRAKDGGRGRVQFHAEPCAG